MEKLFQKVSQYDLNASEALAELIKRCPDIELYLNKKVESCNPENIKRVLNILMLDNVLGGDYRESEPLIVSKVIKEKPDSKAINLVKLYWSLLNLSCGSETDLNLAHARGLNFFVEDTSISRLDFYWTGFNLNSPDRWYRGGPSRNPAQLARELPHLKNEFESARKLIKEWVESNGDRIIYACFRYAKNGQAQPGDLKYGPPVDQIFVGFCPLEQQTIVFIKGGGNVIKKE